MLFIVISSILFFAGILIITWLHSQHHLDVVVDPVRPQKDSPLISVCVPARNEERNIRRCVQALLAQTYPNFEVIVLDDCSTDGTGEILHTLAKDPTLRKAPLKVINGSALPSGWAGKTFALTQAASSARGEWLCFVDADTFVTPEALSGVYAKAVETNADLFTILTKQIMLTFWERALLPLVMTALSVGFSPRKVNDPQRKDAIANGQFIFINRRVYGAIGGHTAIKGSIVEDKDLALLVKGSGYRLVIADGHKVASTRMYMDFGEIWEGWTKNIYLGLRDDKGLLLLGLFGVFVALAAALLLPAWVIWGIFLLEAGRGLDGSVLLIEGLLISIYLVYWRGLAARAMDVPAWYALTTPLGAGVFAAMMLTSAWNVLSGKGVRWKGRTYSKNSSHY